MSTIVYSNSFTFRLQSKDKILYFRIMVLLRKILFPFAIVYGLITSLRNLLFDKGILKSYLFDLPVIVVGNLSVGGTGKTPQIEYLIRLLSPDYKVATLSRGYKRQSKGFVLADENDDATTLGDEPFQYYSKFPQIKVSVDTDRRNGIEQLLSLPEKPDVILLDDAYQHRKVKAGFYILLTSYGDLYADDYMLPTGNLRENRRGARRANVIIVTKCPPELSVQEQEKIRLKLNISNEQQLLFSYINYDDSVYSDKESKQVKQLINADKLLVAGIAKPGPFFKYLQRDGDQVLTFPDHHRFSNKDITDIRDKGTDKIIITTEKDYVRLKDNMEREQLFYLPIKSEFLFNKDNFDKAILNYVREKS